MLGALGRTSTALPVASTPCTAKTFFAKSTPIITIVMDFPFNNKSVRHRASHRGAEFPIAATARISQAGKSL